MRKLLIAISFFTRIPIKIKDVESEEFYKSMILIPVVGALIGLFLYALVLGLNQFGLPDITALLTLIAYLWITGGLHMDGVADTCDAIFSARDKDKMMEIMHDSRLGAFGAISLIILLLAFFVFSKILLPVFPIVIAFMPIVGRYCSLQSSCFSSYAEGGGGLGKRITEYTHVRDIIIYLILIIAALYFFSGIALCIAMGVTVVLNFLLMIYFNKKFGGITGDMMGMTTEVTQVIFLFSTIIVLTITQGL